MEVKVKKMHEKAIVPQRQTAGSGGFDLHLLLDGKAQHTMWKGEREKFRTGLAFEIPEGYGMFIIPRSGLGAKGLTVSNSPGLIDSDYRGEVVMALTNHGESVTLEDGMRVAQAVVMPIPMVEFSEVDELSETERGSGGLGSTGM